MAYPKYKFSLAETKIIHSEEEEKSLRGDWYDSPCAIPQPESLADTQESKKEKKK